MIHSRCLALAVSALLFILSMAPARAADPDLLKRQTVQIKVVREKASTESASAQENAPPEFGSGVILCQKDGLAYLLTAHHVLFGKSENGKRASRRDVKTTEIRFFNDLAPKILEDRDKDEDLITPYAVQSKDLALLVVSMPQELPSAGISHAPLQAELSAGRHAFPVTAVGGDKAGLKVWDERRGELKGREDNLLLHSAPIQEGFSGGPLFDDAGGLIGLNIQISQDTAEGRTLPIEDVLASIQTWIPAGCIERATEDTSQSDAFELYTRAVREISLSRWDAAIPLLQEAIEKRNLEGGSVHLQGMRYTVYLPHYHLGLALYKLGKFQKAYREFSVSEIQGKVKEDKRYRKLVKYKKNAYAKRNEEAKSAS
ncbi:MAG TPA: serine protease [Thermoanaerobaculia bacterium]|nr:serine protease [Thermoanaerobaculia bacterium]